jgi:hypothetical protein
MNAQVNTNTHAAGTILVRTNQVTIRPERMVCITQKEEAGVHAPDRPYSGFQRFMLEVIGTLTARRLV